MSTTTLTESTWHNMSPGKDVLCPRHPTLSISGMSRVDIQRLLTLSDGGSQRKVSLHHPLLVVAIDNRLRGHGQRVALGYVLG